MITFVMLVKDGNLNNVVRTLENNLPSLHRRWNVLVLTDSQCFPAIRNRIQETLDEMPFREYRGESLITFVEHPSFKKARDFLNQMDEQNLVFLWQSGVVGIGVVQNLVHEFVEHPYTGLITVANKAYTLPDEKLYDKNARLRAKDIKNGLVEITACDINNVLMKMSSFEVCELKNKIGLELRRKGYRNYAKGEK